MARFFFSRTDNHRIARDNLTGRAAAILRRASDPIAVLPDGLTGSDPIESTVFRNTGSFIVGDPGRTRNRWRHPQTNQPMSVNPRFFIIEVPTMEANSNAARMILQAGARNADGEYVDRRKSRRLELSNFTQAERDELRATHRIRFTPTRFGQVVTARS